ncbi:MAG TPA: dTDP-4-dehydrorhamnose reductase [Gemmataceae bacterium]|nr:dTDP-4-dehydrorhamnose reductase [Gemmataceae bacterium]
MKYAVIGAKGQLGHDLVARLPGEVTALTHAEADLTKSEALSEKLAQLNPDIVINCAAYNFVDRAESEQAAAFAVNAWGVRDLAKICAVQNRVLVHFSTDYVFGLDGNRRLPYSETDAPGPLSVYGINKLAGEYAVRSICPRHFVIRTCGLYGVWGSGGKGGNFVETMLRVAGQGKPLRVVNDQICTPTYTVDLAEATIGLLKTGQYGLYHLTNSDCCSWFEFAQAIFEMEGIKADLNPIPSSDYPTAAQRPSYSVLAAKAFEARGFAQLRPWRTALAAFLSERRK